MSRRRKHHWQQVVVWPATEKQAKQAHDPGPPHRQLDMDDVIAAFVSCVDCGGIYGEVYQQTCPLRPSTALPGPVIDVGGG